MIHANTSLMQFGELRGRNVELLIGRVPTVLLEDDLALENLFNESLVAVAGHHSRWSRHKHQELADLIDEAWILPPYDSVHSPLVTVIFRANGLQPPRAPLSTLSLQLTTTLIASGRLVGAYAAFRRAVQRRAMRVEHSCPENPGASDCGRRYHYKKSHAEPAGQAFH